MIEFFIEVAKENQLNIMLRVYIVMDARIKIAIQHKQAVY